MCFIAKVIGISHPKFHCKRLATVQDIRYYGVSFFWDTMYCTLADGDGGRENILNHVQREEKLSRGRVWGNMSEGICPDPVLSTCHEHVHRQQVRMLRVRCKVVCRRGCNVDL